MVERYDLGSAEGVAALRAQLPRLPEQRQTRKEGAAWSF